MTADEFLLKMEFMGGLVPEDGNAGVEYFIARMKVLIKEWESNEDREHIILKETW